MEGVDKKVRHTVLKVAALPDTTVRAWGASHHWGSWSIRAGHAAGHSCPEGQLWAECTLCHCHRVGFAEELMVGGQCGSWHFCQRSAEWDTTDYSNAGGLSGMGC